MGIEYKELNQNDPLLEEVASLINHNPPEGLSVDHEDSAKVPLQYLKEAMSEAGLRVLVALEGEAVVGTGSFQFIEREGEDLGYLCYLRVAPEKRGEGIGTELMRRRIDLLRQGGAVHEKINRVLMGSHKNSVENREGFFENRFGFKRVRSIQDESPWIWLEKDFGDD